MGKLKGIVNYQVFGLNKSFRKSIILFLKDSVAEWFEHS